jgi:hypothetical protein
MAMASNVAYWALSVISRHRNTSVAFGVKRT